MFKKTYLSILILFILTGHVAAAQVVDESLHEQVIGEVINTQFEESETVHEASSEPDESVGNNDDILLKSESYQETDADMMKESVITENQTSNLESEKDSMSEKENGESSLLERQITTQQPGVLDVAIMTNPHLTATHVTESGKEKITLAFEGTNLLDLTLLTKKHIIFKLPPEIASIIQKDNLTASYDVPLVSLIIEIGRRTGEFNADQIFIEGDQVYMEINNLLTVGLLSTYRFTLQITLDELPPSTNPEYVFYAQSVKGDIIDLSLLEGNSVGRAVLDAPQFPAPPTVDKPVYSTDTAVTGIAEPGMIVEVTNGEVTYIGTANSDGHFQIEMPAQPVDTNLILTAVNERGHRSEEVSVTVIKPPPDAPKVNAVYSNDTMLYGTGEARAEVKVNILGDEFTSQVDSDGNFAVTIPKQPEGTEITVVLVDRYGSSSMPTTTTVLPAYLNFYSVPEVIGFEDTVITSEPIIIHRKETDWVIQVEDTRGEGSTWQLQAKADAPLTSLTDSSRTLPNALVYVDEAQNISSINGQAVTVYNGETERERITPVFWQKDEGPLVHVTPSEAYADEYTTTITWTLVDGP